MHCQLPPNELQLGDQPHFYMTLDPVNLHIIWNPFACPNHHQTPSGRNLKCMVCPYQLISMSSTCSHSLISSYSNPRNFPCPRSHDGGGEKLFFPLWTTPFLSLSTSLLTPVDPQGIQCHCHIVYSHLQLPDTSGHVRARKSHGCRPFARSGARQHAPDR